MVEVTIVRDESGFWWIKVNGTSIAYVTPTGKTFHISEAWCRVAGISCLEISHNHKTKYRNWNVQRTFHD